jgi:hypothetical protein
MKSSSILLAPVTIMFGAVGSQGRRELEARGDVSGDIPAHQLWV